ncbi:MAG: hypothetical protein IMW89_18550, partial [Ktedonobacteraceae bacterium]|nr:hypothetical protein [Ktedonobacteraceae bacterium]
MQTLTRPSVPLSQFRPPRRRPPYRRISPAMLIGGAVTLIIVLAAGGFLFLQSRVGGHAADVNMDCTLIVPPNPLSAQGLATPYQLVATNPDNGPCNEANAQQSAFVQGAVFDPATGQISIYNPLVVDQGTEPAIQPVVPQLPQNAVVGIWFGFNGGNLTLKGTGNSLQQGRCVNGVNGSVFGQFAYCNAPAFFQAANRAIAAGKLKPPPLGQAKDGMACPSVRDFSIIDMDQSDNLTTTYLVTADGKTAQMTAANAAKLQNAQTQTNASDNRLLSIAVNGALGCKSWAAPDLADPGQMVPALPLNELQAAAHQGNPVALVPAGDPMVLNDNKPDLRKLNAYRVGVDQPRVNNLAQADTRIYCLNFLAVQPARIFLDAQFTRQAASPDPAAANSLFTFLAQRFNGAWGADGLNCQGLIKRNSPIQLKTDGNGVVIDATLNGGQGGNGNGNGGAPVNCAVNGQVIAGCMGTVTINGQQCV